MNTGDKRKPQINLFDTPKERNMKNLEEVFKKSGIPTHTFVEPLEYRKLLVSLRTPGRGLVVEGPSGIGKTTCVLKILDEIGLARDALILSGRSKDDIEYISELPSLGDIGLVIIDDFHRLEDFIKEQLADFIKNLADKEDSKSKVVIIGINQAGNALLQFAHDLTGRIDTIPFEINPDDKIEELINKGENALKIKINIVKDLIREAQGSFHITQMLCHETCIDAGILEEQDEIKEVNISIEVVKQKVFSDLTATFLPRAKKFATGPRLRKEGRAPYFHLLYWLAHNDAWSLQIDEILARYQEHRGSVGQIVEKGYLLGHFESNPELKDVIHFEPQTKVLSIEDPKFVYFIRNILWSKFASQVGYHSLEFPSKYDFALSFAGSDRDVAESLFELLQDHELNIFYDKNEQHRILAKNVEDYLGPIYKSEARFVIVLLGPDYPKRIWTKFESDQFKDRFGENAIIPIWFSNAEPGIFDETTRYGGLSLERKEEIGPQLEKISGILCKRIEEERVN